MSFSWFGSWFGKIAGSGAASSTPLPLSPYAFDTSLARPQRTLIRNGVVELLSGLTMANGGYLRAVVPYGGIVRGYTDEIGIDLLRAMLNGRAPAMVVAVGDRVTAPAGMGGFNAKGEIELVVYHYANFAGSLTDGRTAIGAAAIATAMLDPGLEVMMEHAEELLLGQRVGGSSSSNPIGEILRRTPSIKQIVSTREEELATDNTMTLWAQRYSVMVTRTIDPHRNVSQMLEEIRTVDRTSDAALVGVTPDPAAPGALVVDLQSTTIDTP